MQIIKRGNMGELRKDYILDRWVIVSAGRGKRPRELAKPYSSKHGIDYFAPGHENLTPNEKGRIEGDAGWKIRWFENKFPAVTLEGNPVVETHNRFFTFASAYGNHEVIVETRDNRQLHQLSVKEISDILKIYAKRIDELQKQEDIAYVNVFKNHGLFGGTSILHSHSQVVSTNILPKSVADECRAVRKFLTCPYCDIISHERRSKRFCFENKDVVAFTPYASRYNYEAWIFPKQHITSFSDIPFGSMADILKKVLERINSITNISYNYAVHYSPKGENLHVHIEVYPDIAIWGGFERGSGIVINSVSPEDAAAFYRGEAE
ncbi:galactose-1-phosphate uridylyltransferase [Candidatus Woesearchaeota archaeon]|nr:galactose-1-phosphate uridylyltransferase [Candidatus Woesearchaeota archaeon]